MSTSIRILVFNNQFEAKLLDEILNEKNIPHLIRTYHDSAYDGLWQSQSGWGHLEASEDHRDEILKIYDEMSQQL